MGNDDEISPLDEAIRENTNGRQTKRMIAVRNYLMGMSNHEIAQNIGVSTESVRRWIKKYKQDGINSLMDNPRSGRPSKLDNDLILKLRETLKLSPNEHGYPHQAWTIPLLQHVVEEDFCVSISRSTAHRLLGGHPDSGNTRQSAKYLADHPKIKRFEKMLFDNAKKNIWYIGRFSMGKFPVGVKGSLISFLRLHHVFFSLKTNSTATSAELNILVTIQSSHLPYTFKTYQRFTKTCISNLIKTNGVYEDIICMPNQKWEREIIEFFGRRDTRDTEKSIPMHLIPIKSYPYDFAVFNIMKEFKNEMIKWGKTATLAQSNTRQQITDHAHICLQSIIARN